MTDDKETITYKGRWYEVLGETELAPRNKFGIYIRELPEQPQAVKSDDEEWEIRLTDALDIGNATAALDIVSFVNTKISEALAVKGRE